MTLAETRLELAVRIAVRATRALPDASAAERVAAFAAAYPRIARLEAGDDDWSAATLEAAWALVADAFPRGGDATALAEAVVDAHERLAALAAAPAPNRTRDRRDA